MKTNVPILTFLSRTWMLFILAIASNYAILSKNAYSILGSWEYNYPKGIWEWIPHTMAEYFGGVIYAPPLISVIFIASLLLRHLFYRETIDADVHSGAYLNDWKALSPRDRVWISNAVLIGFLIAFSILCAGIARGDVPNQEMRWATATINPKNSIALDLLVERFKKTETRYQTIEAMRKNGVPAPVLFCLHYRESDNNFRCHAHEGSPLIGRTRDEPKGRIPDKNPPYTFEQSAYDAYYVCEHPSLDQINWHKTQAALDKMESFNGFGYRRHGICSPYLGSGTNLYSRGKYVSDGHYDPLKVDAQMGCIAILKRMQQRGVSLPF